MNQVLNYADTFYQKRFISEKEFRIKQILNGEPYVEGQLIWLQKCIMPTLWSVRDDLPALVRGGC